MNKLTTIQDAIVGEFVYKYSGDDVSKNYFTVTGFVVHSSEFTEDMDGVFESNRKLIMRFKPDSLHDPNVTGDSLETIINQHTPLKWNDINMNESEVQLDYYDGYVADIPLKNFKRDVESKSSVEKIGTDVTVRNIVDDS